MSHTFRALCISRKEVICLLVECTYIKEESTSTLEESIYILEESTCIPREFHWAGRRSAPGEIVRCIGGGH
jgi:hypothetical protein